MKNLRKIEEGQKLYSDIGIKMVAIKKKAAGDSDSRTVEFIASTEAFDRYNESISVAGWDISNFKKNPVILFGHDHTKVVGKAESIKIDTKGKKKALTMVIRFAREGASDLADEVFALVEDEIIGAVSVGFIPKKWVDNEDGSRTFTESELLEVSFVGVPANPEALVQRDGEEGTKKKDAEEEVPAPAAKVDEDEAPEEEEEVPAAAASGVEGTEDEEEEEEEEEEGEEKGIDGEHKELLKSYRKAFKTLREKYGVTATDNEVETVERTLDYIMEAKSATPAAPAKKESKPTLSSTLAANQKAGLGTKLANRKS